MWGRAEGLPRRRHGSGPSHLGVVVVLVAGFVHGCGPASAQEGAPAEVGAGRGQAARSVGRYVAPWTASATPRAYTSCGTLHQSWQPGMAVVERIDQRLMAGEERVSGEIPGYALAWPRQYFGMSTGREAKDGRVVLVRLISPEFLQACGGDFACEDGEMFGERREGVTVEMIYNVADDALMARPTGVGGGGAFQVEAREVTVEEMEEFFGSRGVDDEAP